MPKVNLDDLSLAVQWAADGMDMDQEAWIVLASGAVCMYSPDQEDLCGPMPADLDDPDTYLRVPDRHELGLGSRLVFDFAREVIPEAVDEVRAIFSRKGAYGRFRGFLERRGLLEHWYAYEEARETRALLDWCTAHGLELEIPPRPAKALSRG